MLDTSYGFNNLLKEVTALYMLRVPSQIVLEYEEASKKTL